MATQNIASLGLRGKAKTGAELLLQKFPSIVFTSGKRDLAGQARAMAGNVVKKRDYIKKTYKPSDASRACQKWVDDHPDAKTQAEIAKGLLDTLTSLRDKAGQISKHLTGDAFDVKPVSKDAAAIKDFMRKLPGVTKFLDKEAGLVIWHVQF